MRFLLVAQILELEPVKRIITSKRVAPDEDFFADHFPGYPVVPGVLLLEMIAQSAGKCLMAGMDSALWPVLLQVRQANFRKSVLPGASVQIEASILSCYFLSPPASGGIIRQTQTIGGGKVNSAHVAQPTRAGPPTVPFGFTAESRRSAR